MDIKKATQVLRSGHNPVEVLRALDYCEKNNVAVAVETLLYGRTVFAADLMDEYRDNPKKYKMFGLFTFSKIYGTLSYLTEGSMGRFDPGEYSDIEVVNSYLASAYFDISVANYLLRWDTDTWYFEDIDRYSVFENNIGSNTLKGFGVAKVLERLLPFKEKIKGISITNVRFERLPLVIDEHYSHIDFIKLKDCVFPESFQHPKMIVEYSEGASPIPQPNSLRGHLLSHIDELLEQLEKLSTNENIKTNAPNIKDIQLPYKVFRNGERFVTLEKNNDQPEVIVLFYEHIKSLSFSWKWTDKQTNSFMVGHAHFEPYNTKLMSFEESKNETQFGIRRGWQVDNEVFDYEKATFYIIEKLPDEGATIGCFGGKNSKGILFYQKKYDFYSMGLDFYGYMYFLRITYGLHHWQSVILALSQEDETYDYHSFENSVKILNPDFNLWEFKLTYQKARITDL